jgi:hypothetical protein
MVQDLHRGTFHVSRNWIALPPHYALRAFPAVVPGGGRRTVGSDTTGTTSAGSSSSVSVVSALTSPVRPLPTGERQTRVANPTQDAEFLALELKPRLAELLRLHRPPD